MNLTPLKKIAARHAQDLAVSVLTAGAAALAAQAVNRAMPEVHLEGSNMAWVLHLMAEKPGAVTGPLGPDQDKHWSFGYGHLLFQEGGHWYFARRTQGGSESGRSVSADDSPRLSSYNLVGSTSGALIVRALTGGEASLRALLDAARARYCPPDEVALYVWDRGWDYIRNKSPRPLSTVVIDQNLDQELLADIQAFRADRAWYQKNYVPYRRGYLLYGPPGSGKSTLAGAVAGEAGLNVCILSLNHESLTDATFAHALRQMPKDSMLLLEDVDAVNAQTDRRVTPGWDVKNFPASTSEGDDCNSGSSGLTGIAAISERPAGALTLAGILNALDGLGTPDGLIVMMTTNHREALDPALIRPGRVDRQYEIGMASLEQAERMYARFFPEGVACNWHESFATSLLGETHSPAALQEHLVRYRGDALGALMNKVGS
ncbi:AAA family ATPase [Deinococcus sp. PEB2-67]